MKRIKNFLESQEALIIKNAMEGVEFPWYNSHVVDSSHLGDIPANQNFQFCHKFYNDSVPTSNLSHILNALCAKINPYQWVRIKANLLPRTEKILEHGMHTDCIPKNANVTTAVYYVNTCNGYTRFEDGKKFKSIENSLIEFPSTMRHTGSTCTDEKYRIVINLNYIKV